MVAPSPKNININISQWLPGNSEVFPSLLQFKPKAFYSVYNRSAQFILQLTPNLLSGGWGSDFEGASTSVLRFQQIPSVTAGSGYSHSVIMCRTQAQVHFALTQAEYSGLVKTCFWPWVLPGVRKELNLTARSNFELDIYCCILTRDRFQPSWSLRVAIWYSPALLNCHVENQQQRLMQWLIADLKYL